VSDEGTPGEDGEYARSYLTTVKDGCDDPGAEITSQVGADGDVGEAPDHHRVRQPDDERSAGR